MKRSIHFYYLFMALSNARFTRAMWMLFLLQRGFTVTQIGWLETGYHATRLLADIPTGVLADTWSRRYTMALGALLAAASSLFFTVGHSFAWMMLVFCLEGLSQVMQRGADEALIYAYLAEHDQAGEYARVCGRGNAFSYSALAGATWLGGFVAKSYQFLPFVLQAGACAVAAGIIVLFRETDRAGTGSTSRGQQKQIETLLAGLRVAVRLPLIQFLMWFAAMLVAGATVVSILSQGYFGSLGLNQSAIGGIYALTTGLSVLAALNAHRLVRLGLDVTLVLAPAVFITGLIGMLMGVVPLAVAGFFLVYINLDLLEPALTFFFNRLIPDEVRATVLSSLTALISLVTLILFPLAGRLVDLFGYRSLILGVGAVGLPVFSLMWWIYPRIGKT